MDKNRLRNLLNEINRIKSVIEIVDDTLLVDIDKFDRPFQGFGNVVISGRDNLVAFNYLIDKVWTENKDIYDNFSQKQINREIVNLLTIDGSISSEQIESLFLRLNKIVSKEYWIYKEIDGTILSSENSIVLGPYKIVDKEKHKDEIIANSEYIKNKWHKIWRLCNSNILIGVKIDVKELSRGYEIADMKFKQFENIVRFMIPDFEKNRELCIVNRIDYKLNTSYSINDEFHGISAHRVKTRTESIDLSNPRFYDEKIGTKQLFDILSKKSYSEVEKRILSAIDWIGKGLSEIDYSKAFIQLMFSVESLLNYQKREIIQPSILSKISEFIAFTIGSNYKERLKLEADFKYLYGLRCSIAHGNNAFIGRGDFILLLNIVRDLVWEFLRNIELRNIEKFEKFIDWIKEKKYN